MTPLSVVLVGSSPWCDVLPEGDLNLRTARALADRLGGRYDVVVPRGARGPQELNRDPVHLYRVVTRTRAGFVLAARHAIDHVVARAAEGPRVLVSADPLAALAVEVSRSRRAHPHLFQVQGEILTPGPEYGSRPKRLAIMIVSRWAVRRSSGVRVVSESLKRTVESISGRPVSFVGSRVDTQMFTPVREADSIEAKMAAVVVGSLHPRKNLGTIVRAWRQVVQGLPDARLVIAGEGPDRPRLEALIERLGLSRNVELRGQVSHGELAHLLNTARCLLHPAWSEGQPRAVLEGMACGLPVICSEIPPHREIVPATAGLFVPPGDVEGWARAIAALLRDPVRGAEMGREAHAFVVDRHDSEANFDRMAQLIRTVADEHRLRAAL